MKTATRSVWVLSLILAACQAGEEALGPEGREDGDVPVVAVPVPAAPAALKFSPPQLWNSFFCRKGEVCLVANVNGDYKDDVIAFSHGANNSNAVYVALSSGLSFVPAQQWSSLFCRSTETCAAADVNGDRKADIIAFTRGSTPRVFVSLSTGTGFGAMQQWSGSFCRNGEVCKLADVNADRRADLVAFRHRALGNRNGVYVALSTGSKFGPSREWTTGFCHSTETCEVGHVNGGDWADILAFTRDPGNDVYVGLVQGLKFAPRVFWSSFFCRTGEVCLVADVNGDTRDDVIAFNHGLDGANAVFVGLSTEVSFLPALKWHDFFCTTGQTCAVGDVTGDDKADVIAFTRESSPRVFVGVSQ